MFKNTSRYMQHNPSAGSGSTIEAYVAKRLRLLKEMKTRTYWSKRPKRPRRTAAAEHWLRSVNLPVIRPGEGTFFIGTRYCGKEYRFLDLAEFNRFRFNWARLSK